MLSKIQIGHNVQLEHVCRLSNCSVRQESLYFPLGKKGKSRLRIVLFEPFSVRKIFLWMRKTMQWATTWVFLSFSCIFVCSLTFFSVHLDASHWNLEFFGFTQTTFFVHPKNSRFQCSASRFTEKTVSSQPKMQEKLKKTSGCSLHCFPHS